MEEYEVGSRVSQCPHRQEDPMQDWHSDQKPEPWAGVTCGLWPRWFILGLPLSLPICIAVLTSSSPSSETRVRTRRGRIWGTAKCSVWAGNNIDCGMHSLSGEACLGAKPALCAPWPCNDRQLCGCVPEGSARRCLGHCAGLSISAVNTFMLEQKFVF